MFNSARVKLTFWYLIIIMLITITFSIVVYIGVERNTRRALEGQQRRFERHYTQSNLQLKFPMGVPLIDAEALEEFRRQTILTLILINLGVLVLSGSVGYFLAGSTLSPIEEMVLKQKRFISDATHEIKTPLTSMKTSLEVALREKDLNATDAREVLKSSLDDVEKLHKLTTRLLDQSKYRNGKIQKYEEVQLDTLIKSVVKDLDMLAKEKDQEFKMNLTSVKIQGIRVELAELLINLFENAIKFNSPLESINISLTTVKGFAIIEVEDFGVGIAAEDLPFIYDPFFRADKSRSDSARDGYGIGLSIVKDIVERHKGEISASSVLGKGTKFIVKLPLNIQGIKL